MKLLMKWMVDLVDLTGGSVVAGGNGQIFGQTEFAEVRQHKRSCFFGFWSL
jgi:hypothetical protein